MYVLTYVRLYAFRDTYVVDGTDYLMQLASARGAGIENRE